MKKSKSTTLLDLLAQTYPDFSREKLFSRILCGEIFVNGVCCRDPKSNVGYDAVLTFSSWRMISRGRLKLESAIEAWNWPVADLIFLDAGASAGGFTEVLLKKGAAFVHAVDVGVNQLDWRLRHDSRVGVYERTNVMSVKQLDPLPHAAVVDLSFRSLRKAAAHILALTSEKQIIALVKPQFEWREPDPDFNGIVPKDKIRGILQDLFDDLHKEGVTLKKQLLSPLRGRKGNQEYLVWLQS